VIKRTYREHLSGLFADRTRQKSTVVR